MAKFPMTVATLPVVIEPVEPLLTAPVAVRVMSPFTLETAALRTIEFAAVIDTAPVPFAANALLRVTEPEVDCKVTLPLLASVEMVFWVVIFPPTMN